MLARDVRVDDLLLSRSEFDPDGPVVARRVEEVFVREGLIYGLRVRGREIETTAEHPFYAWDRGWVACQELRVGDLVRLEDGWAAVEAMTDTGRWETVYNFRIADDHTYFVGCDEWGFSVWAHNAECANPQAIADVAGVKRTVKDRAARIMREKGEADAVAYLAKQLDESGHLVGTAKAQAAIDASKISPQVANHARQITPEMQAWADKHGAKLIDPGDPAIKDLRARYMGDTPEKGSAVHKAVVDRMLADGELRMRGGVIELPYTDSATKTTKWIDIRSKDVHMGHLEDAVTFWNQTGRFTGAKSVEVRAFMTDSSKYALQYRSNNIAAGNKIKTREYFPTPIASLPVIG